MTGSIDTDNSSEIQPLLPITNKETRSSNSSGELYGRTFDEVKLDIERFGNTVRDVKWFNDKIFITAFLCGVIVFSILLGPCIYKARSLSNPYYTFFYMGGNGLTSFLLAGAAYVTLRCMYGYRSAGDECKEIVRLYREAVNNNVLDDQEKRELTKVAKESLNPIV